jgi:hypothetical protein
LSVLVVFFPFLLQLSPGSPANCLSLPAILHEEVRQRQRRIQKIAARVPTLRPNAGGGSKCPSLAPWPKERRLQEPVGSCHNNEVKSGRASRPGEPQRLADNGPRLAGTARPTQESPEGRHQSKSDTLRRQSFLGWPVPGLVPCLQSLLFHGRPCLPGARRL